MNKAITFALTQAGFSQDGDVFRYYRYGQKSSASVDGTQVTFTSFEREGVIVSQISLDLSVIGDLDLAEDIVAATAKAFIG